MDSKGRSSNLTYTASWSHFAGDNTATAFTPSGGEEVGLLFTKFGVPPAPTGYFPGAAGLDSQARTEVDYGRLEFGIKWLQVSDWIPDKTRLIPKLRFSWTQFDYQVITTDTFDPAIVPPSDYRDERDQQMQQDLFALQIGSRLESKFGDRNQFSVYGDVGLDLYVLKAYLSSFDYVTLDGDTRLRWIGEGERKAFFGIDLGLGLAWNISSRWSINLSAEYSPWVPTAIIVNPTTAEFGGAQAYVDTMRESQATFLLGVAYGF